MILDPKDKRALSDIRMKFETTDETDAADSLKLAEDTLIEINRVRNELIGKLMRPNIGNHGL